MSNDTLIQQLQAKRNTMAAEWLRMHERLEALDRQIGEIDDQIWREQNREVNERVLLSIELRQRQQYEAEQRIHAENAAAHDAYMRRQGADIELVRRRHEEDQARRARLEQEREAREEANRQAKLAALRDEARRLNVV